MADYYQKIVGFFNFLSLNEKLDSLKPWEAKTQEDCGICMGDMYESEGVRLGCNHSFHKQCIQ